MKINLKDLKIIAIDEAINQDLQKKIQNLNQLKLLSIKKKIMIEINKNIKKNRKKTQDHPQEIKNIEIKYKKVAVLLK